MNRFVLFVFLGIGIPGFLFAQSNLFVLKFEGQPITNINGNTSEVTKGTAINKSTKVILQNNDALYVINNEGDVFEVNKPGNYRYKDLLKLEPLTTNDSYSKKLMTYFWKEFTNSLSGSSSKTGVVYRGDYVELISPKDDTSMFTDEINFEWTPKEGKTRPYYFVIREQGSEHYTMIGIYDSQLSFRVDNFNLKNGSQYEWTIVESKYENLNKVEFSRFKILNDHEFKNISQEVEQLTSFLTNLDYEKSEIRAIICDYYKTCL